MFLVTFISLSFWDVFLSVSYICPLNDFVFVSGYLYILWVIISPFTFEFSVLSSKIFLFVIVQTIIVPYGTIPPVFIYVGKKVHVWCIWLLRRRKTHKIFFETWTCIHIFRTYSYERLCKNVITFLPFIRFTSSYTLWIN